MINARDSLEEGAMPVTYLEGDATMPITQNIIIQICNDIGGWGGGFVLAVSDRFPDPEDQPVSKKAKPWPGPRNSYLKWGKDPLTLGSVQLVNVGPQTWVANIIGQHDIVVKDGVPPIRYEEVREALRWIAWNAKLMHATIHMPRIGCNLASGTWDVMGKIVEEELEGLNVYVYDFVDETKPWFVPPKT